MRDKITKLFEEVGNDYKKRDVATFDIHQGHDVHAFYRLFRNSENFVHVQGYPGMSTEEEARVYARLMDYNKAMEIRKSGMVSIGNEHKAVVKYFPNFKNGVMILYNTRILEEMLAENIPEFAADIVVPSYYFPKLDLKKAAPENETNFEVKYHHRHDLRSWIRNNFSFVEHPPLKNEELMYLQRRAPEIMNACRMVEEKDKSYNSNYVEYYSSCWKKLEGAYKVEDYTEFASGLDYLLSSIDWE